MRVLIISSLLFSLLISPVSWGQTVNNAITGDDYQRIGQLRQSLGIEDNAIVYNKVHIVPTPKNIFITLTQNEINFINSFFVDHTTTNNLIIEKFRTKVNINTQEYKLDSPQILYEWLTFLFDAYNFVTRKQDRDFIFHAILKYIPTAVNKLKLNPFKYIYPDDEWSGLLIGLQVTDEHKYEDFLIKIAREIINSKYQNTSWTNKTQLLVDLAQTVNNAFALINALTKITHTPPAQDLVENVYNAASPNINFTEELPYQSLAPNEITFIKNTINTYSSNQKLKNFVNDHTLNDELHSSSAHPFFVLIIDEILQLEALEGENARHLSNIQKKIAHWLFMLHPLIPSNQETLSGLKLKSDATDEEKKSFIDYIKELTITALGYTYFDPLLSGEGLPDQKTEINIHARRIFFIIYNWFHQNTTPSENTNFDVFLNDAHDYIFQIKEKDYLARIHVPQTSPEAGVTEAPLPPELPPETGGEGTGDSEPEKISLTSEESNLFIKYARKLSPPLLAYMNEHIQKYLINGRFVIDYRKDQQSGRLYGSMPFLLAASDELNQIITNEDDIKLIKNVIKKLIVEIVNRIQSDNLDGSTKDFVPDQLTTALRAKYLTEENKFIGLRRESRQDFDETAARLSIIVMSIINIPPGMIKDNNTNLDDYVAQIETLKMDTSEIQDQLNALYKKVFYITDYLTEPEKDLVKSHSTLYPDALNQFGAQYINDETPELSVTLGQDNEKGRFFGSAFFLIPALNIIKNKASLKSGDEELIKSIEGKIARTLFHHDETEEILVPHKNTVSGLILNTKNLPQNVTNTADMTDIQKKAASQSVTYQSLITFYTIAALQAQYLTESTRDTGLTGESLDNFNMTAPQIYFMISNWFVEEHEQIQIDTQDPDKKAQLAVFSNTLYQKIFTLETQPRSDAHKNSSNLTPEIIRVLKNFVHRAKKIDPNLKDFIDELTPETELVINRYAGEVSGPLVDLIAVLYAIQNDIYMEDKTEVGNATGIASQKLAEFLDLPDAPSNTSHLILGASGKILPDNITDDLNFKFKVLIRAILYTQLETVNYSSDFTLEKFEKEYANVNAFIKNWYLPSNGSLLYGQLLASEKENASSLYQLMFPTQQEDKNVEQDLPEAKTPETTESTTDKKTEEAPKEKVATEGNPTEKEAVDQTAADKETSNQAAIDEVTMDSPPVEQTAENKTAMDQSSTEQKAEEKDEQEVLPETPILPPKTPDIIDDNSLSLDQALDQVPAGKGIDDPDTETIMKKYITSYVETNQPLTEVGKFMDLLVRELIKYWDDYHFAWLLTSSSESDPQKAAQNCIDQYKDYPDYQKHLDKSWEYNAQTMITATDARGTTKHVCAMIFSSAKRAE